MRKRIWILWTQGLDRAPPLTRACMESWTRENPGWEVQVLTGETLRDWTDPVLCTDRARSILPYRLSELARLNLLARHGGVWADATCYCMRPLDEWLPERVGSGFFAFASPGRDRLLASWFLASEPGGPVVERMWPALRDYYLGYALSDVGWRRGARRALDKVLNRNTLTPALWFWPPLPALGITPYFAFHYTFARLLRRDASVRDVWSRTPKVSADGSHSLQTNGLGRRPSRAILADIERRAVPVYKLNWRVDPAELAPSSTLRVLLEHAGAAPAALACTSGREGTV